MSINLKGKDKEEFLIEDKLVDSMENISVKVQNVNKIMINREQIHF